MKVDGVAVASMSVGVLFVYAGVKGYSIPQTVQSLVSGKSPAGQAQTTPVGTPVVTLTSPAGGSITSKGGNPSGTDAQNQALGRKMAVAYGWSTGDEWTALNNIAMAESGWSDTIVNPSSGAAGIAQKISGWSSDYQEGNAPQQLHWFLNYIKGRYGDPIAAWKFHLIHDWY
jgi:hypothetical protein